jgi:hypothetical protein
MELIEKVRNLVKPQYDELECWVHRWPHVEDVAKNSWQIAECERTNVRSCVIASYCHDLGRIQEEKRKQNGENPLPHALLSIEPTVKVLQSVGISGVDFNEIIEAVTIHSYKVYEGNNIVAKVLQDADKISSGFGPYRLLGIIKYFTGKDYVSSNEIIINKKNPEKLYPLCEISLKSLEKEDRQKVIKGISFNLEWQDMMHTDTAKEMIKGEQDYLRSVRNYLINSV